MDLLLILLLLYTNHNMSLKQLIAKKMNKKTHYFLASLTSQKLTSIEQMEYMEIRKSPRLYFILF